MEGGTLFIPHPKEKRPKLIPLLPEDVELVRQFPRGFPDQPLFRHPRRINRANEGEPYGQNYFRKWWRRACKNLNVEDVGLYGGTRHSSARALGEHYSSEDIKRATMHTTNKAFERYYQMGPGKLRDIYRDAGKSTTKEGQTVVFKRGDN